MSWLPAPLLRLGHDLLWLADTVRLIQLHLFACEPVVNGTKMPKPCIPMEILPLASHPVVVVISALVSRKDVPTVSFYITTDLPETGRRH